MKLHTHRIFSHSLFLPLPHFYTPQETGKRVPDSPYATSVCLPTWSSVQEYIQHKNQKHSAYEYDYPRFSLSPLVQDLLTKCTHKFATPQECVFVYPSKKVALRAQEFIAQKTGKIAKLHPYKKHGLVVLSAPQECFSAAQKYWQYSGEIVSARLAQAALSCDYQEKVKFGRVAKKTLRQRISEICGEPPQNIVLFPTGMSAIATVHRFLRISFPERKSVQFGFPYSDTLRVQEEFGEGVHFFPKGDDADLKELEELLKKEKVLGIFCEVPGNALLKTVNVQRLAMLSKKYTVPIIVDDTIGTFQNVNVFPFADIAVSSLSKFFSGQGNVTGGSLIVHSKSRFGPMFARVFKGNFEDLLWEEDAIALEENSRDFQERMQQVNATAEKLCDVLKHHEAVYRVFSPKFQTPEKFTSMQKNGAGFGGLFSFLLYNPEVNTPKLYDALKIAKAPSFGNNFTMVCPYSQIILSDNMKGADAQGISPYLLRVSVGLEDADELTQIFVEALETLDI